MKYKIFFFTLISIFFIQHLYARPIEEIEQEITAKKAELEDIQADVDGGDLTPDALSAPQQQLKDLEAELAAEKKKKSAIPEHRITEVLKAVKDQGGKGGGKSEAQYRQEALEELHSNPTEEDIAQRIKERQLEDAALVLRTKDAEMKVAQAQQTAREEFTKVIQQTRDHVLAESQKELSVIWPEKFRTPQYKETLEALLSSGMVADSIGGFVASTSQSQELRAMKVALDAIKVKFEEAEAQLQQYMQALQEFAGDKGDQIRSDLQKHTVHSLKKRELLIPSEQKISFEALIREMHNTVVLMGQNAESGKTIATKAIPGGTGKSLAQLQQEIEEQQRQDAERQAARKAEKAVGQSASTGLAAPKVVTVPFVRSTANPQLVDIERLYNGLQIHHQGIKDLILLIQEALVTLYPTDQGDDFKNYEAFYKAQQLTRNLKDLTQDPQGATEFNNVKLYLQERINNLCTDVDWQKQVQFSENQALNGFEIFEAFITYVIVLVKPIPEDFKDAQRQESNELVLQLLDDIKQGTKEPTTLYSVVLAPKCLGHENIWFPPLAPSILYYLVSLEKTTQASITRALKQMIVKNEAESDYIPSQFLGQDIENYLQTVAQELLVASARRFPTFKIKDHVDKIIEAGERKGKAEALRVIAKIESANWINQSDMKRLTAQLRTDIEAEDFDALATKLKIARERLTKFKEQQDKFNTAKELFDVEIPRFLQAYADSYSTASPPEPGVSINSRGAFVVFMNSLQDFHLLNENIYAVCTAWRPTSQFASSAMSLKKIFKADITKWACDVIFEDFSPWQRFLRGKGTIRTISGSGTVTDIDGILEGIQQKEARRRNLVSTLIHTWEQGECFNAALLAMEYLRGVYPELFLAESDLLFLTKSTTPDCIQQLIKRPMPISTSSSSGTLSPKRALLMQHFDDQDLELVIDSYKQATKAGVTGKMPDPIKIQRGIKAQIFRYMKDQTLYDALNQELFEAIKEVVEPAKKTGGVPPPLLGSTSSSSGTLSPKRALLMQHFDDQDLELVIDSYKQATKAGVTGKMPDPIKIQRGIKAQIFRYMKDQTLYDALNQELFEAIKEVVEPAKKTGGVPPPLLGSTSSVAIPPRSTSILDHAEYDKYLLFHEDYLLAVQKLVQLDSKGPNKLQPLIQIQRNTLKEQIRNVLLFFIKEWFASIIRFKKNEIDIKGDISLIKFPGCLSKISELGLQPVELDEAIKPILDKHSDTPFEQTISKPLLEAKHILSEAEIKAWERSLLKLAHSKELKETLVEPYQDLVKHCQVIVQPEMFAVLVDPVIITQEASIYSKPKEKASGTTATPTANKKPKHSGPSPSSSSTGTFVIPKLKAAASSHTVTGSKAGAGSKKITFKLKKAPPRNQVQGSSSQPVASQHSLRPTKKSRTTPEGLIEETLGRTSDEARLERALITFAEDTRRTEEITFENNIGNTLMHIYLGPGETGNQPSPHSKIFDALLRLKKVSTDPDPTWNFEHTNNLGETVLLAALKNSSPNPEIIDYLVNTANVNVGAVDNQGNGVLHLLMVNSIGHLHKKEVAINFFLVLEILIKKDINCNLQNKDGNTALHTFVEIVGNSELLPSNIATAIASILVTQGTYQLPQPEVHTQGSQNGQPKTMFDEMLSGQLIFNGGANQLTVAQPCKIETTNAQGNHVLHYIALHGKLFNDARKLYTSLEHLIVLFVAEIPNGAEDQQNLDGKSPVEIALNHFQISALNAMAPIKTHVKRIFAKKETGDWLVIEATMHDDVDTESKALLAIDQHPSVLTYRSKAHHNNNIAHMLLLHKNCTPAMLQHVIAKRPELGKEQNDKQQTMFHTAAEQAKLRSRPELFEAVIKSKAQDFWGYDAMMKHIFEAQDAAGRVPFGHLTMDIVVQCNHKDLLGKAIIALQQELAKMVNK